MAVEDRCTPLLSPLIERRCSIPFWSEHNADRAWLAHRLVISAAPQRGPDAVPILGFDLPFSIFGSKSRIHRDRDVSVSRFGKGRSIQGLAIVSQNAPSLLGRTVALRGGRLQKLWPTRRAAQGAS